MFGPGYKDYMLMRLDGECWEGDPHCTVTFERQENRITIRTENAGISLKNTATISGENNKIYVALTGDQTAITNIRIYK